MKNRWSWTLVANNKTIFRKLKLQLQMPVDGYIAKPNGEMDWMVWNWDDKLIKYVNELTETVDTILLGRKMTEGFISHWSDVISKPTDPYYAFGKKMIDTPKVVFTKPLKKSEWVNTDIGTGDLTDEINELKSKTAKTSSYMGVHHLILP